jgi:hypothetical protein
VQETALEFLLDFGRIEIEGLWIDIYKYWTRASARNATRGGKEAKGGGDYLISGGNACGSQGQPEGVRSGSASDSVVHATQERELVLKSRYLFTQNVMLGIANPGYGVQNFATKAGILPR